MNKVEQLIDISADICEICGNEVYSICLSCGSQPLFAEDELDC